MDDVKSICQQLLAEKLIFLACFFAAVLVSQPVKAGTFCNLSDVPLTEVVTGYDTYFCSATRDGMVTSRFQGTTSTRNVCLNYYEQRNYLGTGLIYPSPWYVSPYSRGSRDSCAPIGRMQHLSTLTSSDYACRNTFNKSDLKAYGIVVTRIESSSDCASYNTTVNSARYRLEKLSATETNKVICASESSVPDGWVVTATGTSLNCSSSNVAGSTLTIRKIPTTGTITACGLPEDLGNYVFRQTSGTCNNSPQYEIGYAFDNGQSCGVPTGMVATAAASSSLCTGALYTVRFPTNNMVACDVGNAPDPNNFVVSSVGTSTNCRSTLNGTGRTWTLRTPAAGVAVCVNYGLPSSWGYQNPETSSSSCGGGYRVTLAALSNGTAYCYKPSLAAGWVYTAITSTVSSLCSTQVQYQVGQPSASGRTNICYLNEDNGPVPAGYMVVSNRSGTTTCVRGSSMQIEPVRSGLQVCTTQNLPANYVITNTYGSDTNCSIARYEINQATGNGPYYTCRIDLIPEGYLITGVTNSIDCGSTPGYRIQRPNQTGVTEVCQAQNLDLALLGTGLAVLGYNNSNQSCVTSGTTRAYLMGYPATSGRTTICTTRLDYVPEGFQVYQTGTYSVCNNSAGMIIEPVAAGGAIPDAFVLPEPDVTPSNIPATTYDCGGTGTSTVLNGATRNTATCP